MGVVPKTFARLRASALDNTFQIRFQIKLLASSIHNRRSGMSTGEAKQALRAKVYAKLPNSSDLLHEP